MLHLAPYVGTGGIDDAFRPAGVDGVRWWGIDLRPDPTVTDGWCLLRTESPLPDESGLHRLGELDETPNRPTSRQLEQRLGLDRDVFARLTWRQIVIDTLVVHGDDIEPRGRWKRLLPDTLGHLTIHLGEVIFDMPVPAGGASITETWPNTGTLTAAAQDLSWSSLSGSLGNWEVHTVGTLTHNISNFQQIVASEQVDGDDNEIDGVLAQVDRSTGTFAQAFFGARCASAAFTGYFVRIDHSGSDRRLLLRRVVAGAHTDISSLVTFTYSSPHDVRCKVEGSTVSGFVDDVELASVTDTNITTGTNTILGSVRHSSALVVEFGGLTFADVGGAGGTVYDETGRTASASGVAAVSDVLAATDSGAVTAAAATDTVDTATYTDSGTVTATAASAAADTATFTDSATATGAAATSVTDATTTVYDEAGRTADATGQTATSDDLAATDSLTATATGATATDDTASLTDALAASAQATTATTDTLTSVGVFDETGRQATASAATATVDALTATEQAAADATATATATDVATFTDTATVTATAATAVGDSTSTAINERGLAADATAATTTADTLAAVERGTADATATTSSADVAALVEQLATTATATTAVGDVDTSLVGPAQVAWATGHASASFATAHPSVEFETAHPSVESWT